MLIECCLFTLFSCKLQLITFQEAALTVQLHPSMSQTVYPRCAAVNDKWMKEAQNTHKSIKNEHFTPIFRTHSLSFILHTSFSEIIILISFYVCSESSIITELNNNKIIRWFKTLDIFTQLSSLTNRTTELIPNLKALA